LTGPAVSESRRRLCLVCDWPSRLEPLGSAG